MRLEQIYFRNILNFEELCMTLKEFSLLVGPNGSGKSNIIRVLNAVNQYIDSFSLFRLFDNKGISDSPDTYNENESIKAHEHVHNNAMKRINSINYIRKSIRNGKDEAIISLTYQLNKDELKRYCNEVFLIPSGVYSIDPRVITLATKILERYFSGEVTYQLTVTSANVDLDIIFGKRETSLKDIIIKLLNIEINRTKPWCVDHSVNNLQRLLDEINGTIIIGHDLIKDSVTNFTNIFQDNIVKRLHQRLYEEYFEKSGINLEEEDIINTTGEIEHNRLIELLNQYYDTIESKCLGQLDNSIDRLEGVGERLLKQRDDIRKIDTKIKETQDRLKDNPSTDKKELEKSLKEYEDELKKNNTNYEEIRKLINCDLYTIIRDIMKNQPFIVELPNYFGLEYNSSRITSFIVNKTIKDHGNNTVYKIYKIICFNYSYDIGGYPFNTIWNIFNFFLMRYHSMIKEHTNIFNYAHINKFPFDKCGINHRILHLINKITQDSVKNSFVMQHEITLWNQYEHIIAKLLSQGDGNGNIITDLFSRFFYKTLKVVENKSDNNIGQIRSIRSDLSEPSRETILGIPIVGGIRDPSIFNFPYALTMVTEQNVTEPRVTALSIVDPSIRPERIDVQVELLPNRLQFREENNNESDWFSSEYLSGGEKEALILIYHLAHLDNINGIFLDEPLSGAHSSLLRYAINMLKDKSPGKTIMIVTHRSEFIGRHTQNSIRYLKKSPNKSEVIPIPEDWYSFLYICPIVFDRKVLFVEGPTDKRFFDILESNDLLGPDWRRNFAIHIMHANQTGLDGGGCSNLPKCIAKANELGIQWAAIVDGDFIVKFVSIKEGPDRFDDDLNNKEKLDSVKDNLDHLIAVVLSNLDIQNGPKEVLKDQTISPKGGSTKSVKEKHLAFNNRLYDTLYKESENELKDKQCKERLVQNLRGITDFETSDNKTRFRLLIDYITKELLKKNVLVLSYDIEFFIDFSAGNKDEGKWFELESEKDIIDKIETISEYTITELPLEPTKSSEFSRLKQFLNTFNQWN